MARPQGDTPLVVDVKKWRWWYDDDGTYAFPNPIRGTKRPWQITTLQKCTCKNRFVRQKYPIQTWYTQQQNSLANFPQKNVEKTDRRCTTSFTTTTTARRNFTLAAIRRAIVHLRSRFTRILFPAVSHALGFRSRLQWFESPRATELRVLTAHPMADSSLALLPLLDNFCLQYCHIGRIWELE